MDSHANTVVFSFTASKPNSQVIPRSGSRMMVLLTAVLEKRVTQYEEWLNWDIVMAVALCTSQQTAPGSTLPAYSVTFDRDGGKVLLLLQPYLIILQTL